MRKPPWVAAIFWGLSLWGCGPIDNSIHPVTITADPDSLYTGDSTELHWSSPGGIQVLKSNFGANTVNGSTTVWPSGSTEYSITIRLASNDIYTAKVSVSVQDPPDDGGGDNGDTEYKKNSRSKGP